MRPLAPQPTGAPISAASDETLISDLRLSSCWVLPALAQSLDRAFVPLLILRIAEVESGLDDLLQIRMADIDTPVT